MLQIYTGVPGSGKSYKMVNDLFAEYNKRLKQGKELTIISNIDNLKLPHLDLDMLISSAPVVEDKKSHITAFWSLEYQTELVSKYNQILYCVDECQGYFPSAFFPRLYGDMFEKHRHIGLTFFMATQSTSLISRGLLPLIELEFNAVRRTFSFFGEFKYRIKSPQTKKIIEMKSIRPKQEIFDLYKSFDNAETKSAKAKLFLMMLLPLVIFIIGGIFFYYKSLRVPDRPISDTDNISLQSCNNDKDFIAVQNELLSVRKQLDSLKNELLVQTKRVFLPIMRKGKQRYTIDPDTRIVVELEAIKKPVKCLGGLNGQVCWYDDLIPLQVDNFDNVHSNNETPFFDNLQNQSMINVNNGLYTSSPVNPKLQ